jgi:hypothetical protein
MHLDGFDALAHDEKRIPCRGLRDATTRCCFKSDLWFGAHGLLPFKLNLWDFSAAIDALVNAWRRFIDGRLKLASGKPRVRPLRTVATNRAQGYSGAG